jgi:hypothetical protein
MKKKIGNPRPISQKLMSLKVDNDLLEYLKENKPVNRFINKLIRDSKNLKQPTLQCPDGECSKI